LRSRGKAPIKKRENPTDLRKRRMPIGCASGWERERAPENKVKEPEGKYVLQAKS